MIAVRTAVRAAGLRDLGAGASGFVRVRNIRIDMNQVVTNRAARWAEIAATHGCSSWFPGARAGYLRALAGDSHR